MIPGCSLWLDAADPSTLTLSGSNVAQWRDKSGNGNSAFVTTSANQPTYANNRLTFSGAQYLFTPLNSRIERQTLFAIVSTSATDIVQRAVLGQSGREARGGYSFYLADGGSRTQRVHTWGGSPGIKGAALDQNQVYIYGATVVSATGSAVLYLNGNLAVSGSVASLSSSEFTYVVGSGNGGTGGGLPEELLQGTLGELLLWNNVLSETERQQIEGYLADKWGLKANLPAAHPFKIAPLISRPFGPLDVAGCALWLDAADPSTLTLSGSNVTQWRDKSSTGTFAQPQRGHSGIIPTLTTSTGVPSIFINNLNSTAYNTGTYTQLTVQANIQTAADYSVFAVINLTQLAASSELQTIYTNRRVATAGERRAPQMGAGSSYEANTFDNTTRNASGGGFIGTGRLQTSLVASSDAFIQYKDGVVFGSSGASANRFTTDADPLPSIGGTFNSVEVDNRFATGHFHELLVYTQSVSTAQRQQIEGYLANKWGIRASVPTTHPFKLFPPLVPIFSPRDIDGCALWLDGADPLGTGAPPVVGGTVSTWSDKSGNGKHGTATGTPIYISGGGIQFNGTNSTYINTNFQYDLSKRSFFVLVKVNTFFQYGGIFSFFPNPISSRTDQSPTGAVLSTQPPNGAGFEFYANGGGYASFILVPVLQTNLINENMNVRAGSGFANGTLKQSVGANYTAGVCSGYGIGSLFGNGSANGAPYQLAGNIYEILCFTGPVTAPQRQAIEGYLMHKWGLVGSLPATHPYKTIKP
jgi:hypothetical protein